MKLEDIERIITNRGLVAALLEFDRAGLKDKEMIARFAEAASRHDVLLSALDADLLRGISAPQFFNIQSLLCEIIPFLDATPSEVMNLVHLFVEKGGDDLAANQPNLAFRKWCAADTRRADEVILSARAGASLSLHHLAFALEGKGDVQEAFRSAEADDEERNAGVQALSRMELTRDEASHAIEHIVRIAQASEPGEAVKLLNAALKIGGKHLDIDRGQLAAALHRISGSEDPIIVHLMAAALHWHLSEMTSHEVQSCLDGILRVDTENKGTIREIDAALQNLWNIEPMQASQAAAKLIAHKEGGIDVDDLPVFFSATKGDHRNLTRLATEWLQAGDFYVCSTLTSHLSDIGRTTPCVDVQPDDLPPSKREQLFICRKAIGFLFTSPMTAASWIVAVLRSGDADAAKEVSDLLFDPLLLNYGGALKDWLEDLAKIDAPGTEVISSLLGRAQKVWDDCQAARELVELEPPASHRALVRFREADDTTHVHEMARKKSIFAQVVTTQTLLYGDQSSFSIRDGDGQRHSQSVHMTHMSVSSELPKGLFFDPAGTEWLIETFRRERRETA